MTNKAKSRSISRTGRTRRIRVEHVKREIHSVDAESTRSIMSNRTGMWGKKGTEINHWCMNMAPLPCKSDKQPPGCTCYKYYKRIINQFD